MFAAASTIAETPSPVFAAFANELEFARSFTAFVVPRLIENAGAKVTTHELPPAGVQVCWAALPHAALVVASIKSIVKAAVPLTTAEPINLITTVLIVRSSDAFAFQLRVAMSSTATRVRALVAPSTLEVKVGFVRNTVWAVPSVAPVIVAAELESLP